MLVLHAIFGLFCEMTRAADNTWKNTYLAARKDENGMYTFSETIWDLNYTFGEQFISIFNTEPAVIAAGMERLRVMALAFMISAVMDC